MSMTNILILVVASLVIVLSDRYLEGKEVRKLDKQIEEEVKKQRWSL